MLTWHHAALKMSGGKATHREPETRRAKSMDPRKVTSWPARRRRSAVALSVMAARIAVEGQGQGEVVVVVVVMDEQNGKEKGVRKKEAEEEGWKH